MSVELVSATFASFLSYLRFLTLHAPMLSLIQPAAEGHKVTLQQKLSFLGFDGCGEVNFSLLPPSLNDQINVQDYLLPEAFSLVQEHSIELPSTEEPSSLTPAQMHARISILQSQISAFEQQNAVLSHEIESASQMQGEYNEEFKCLVVEFTEQCASLANAVAVLQNSVLSFRECELPTAGFSNAKWKEFLVGSAEECCSFAAGETGLLKETLQEVGDLFGTFREEICILAAEKAVSSWSEEAEALKGTFAEFNRWISQMRVWLMQVNRMFLVASEAMRIQQRQWKEEELNLGEISAFLTSISQQLSKIISCFGAATSSAVNSTSAAPFQSLFQEPANQLQLLMQELLPSLANQISPQSCISPMDSTLRPQLSSIFHQANSIHERITAIEDGKAE